MPVRPYLMKSLSKAPHVNRCDFCDCEPSTPDDLNMVVTDTTTFHTCDICRNLDELDLECCGKCNIPCQTLYVRKDRDSGELIDLCGTCNHEEMMADER